MRLIKGRAAKNARGKGVDKAALKRRRKAAPRWVRPVLRGAVATAAVALLIGGPVWMWRSGVAGAIHDGVHRSAVAVTADMGLTVRAVLLEGRRNTPRADVLRAVSLKRGDAMFGFDPAGMRARLVALPWVRDATVERRLPGTVNIRILEHRPLALWQRDRQLALIDDRGEVIEGADLGKFRDLPIVVGPDAARHAATLIALLGTEPALASKVSAAVRVGKRRWNIRLAGGIQVQLPETGAHAAWRRLARLEARHRLLARDIRNIDMRLPDRLIVRAGETGREAAPVRGKRT